MASHWEIDPRTEQSAWTCGAGPNAVQLRAAAFFNDADPLKPMQFSCEQQRFSTMLTP
jgi:hypothetical protein